MKTTQNLFVAALLAITISAIVLLSLLGKSTSYEDIRARLSQVDARVTSCDRRIEQLQRELLRMSGLYARSSARQNQLSSSPPDFAPAPAKVPTEDEEPGRVTTKEGGRHESRLRKDIKLYDVDQLCEDIGVTSLTEAQRADVASLLADHQAQCQEIDEIYYRRLDEINTEKIRDGKYLSAAEYDELVKTHPERANVAITSHRGIPETGETVVLLMSSEDLDTQYSELLDLRRDRAAVAESLLKSIKAISAK